MQYIASQKPNSLWPDDARTRADIMRWQSWQLAHWGKEGCEPLIFNRLVKKLLNLGPPDEAAVAKGLECFNREATVLDAHLGEAAVPGRQGRDACRLLGRGAAVPRAGGGPAGRRPIRKVPRMVRPRLGAAVLEPDRAAVPSRRGLT